MFILFSVQEVTILLNLPQAIKRNFQFNAFTSDYCDLKTKVFYSYLQNYGTTETMRQNCSNFRILLDCIVM